MPIYEYQCRACGRRSEEFQKMSDPPLTECAECGGELRKLISAPAVQFKGSGWYVTDYAKSGAKPGDSGSSGSSGSGGSSSSSGSGDSGGSGGSGGGKDSGGSDAGSSSSGSNSSGGGSEGGSSAGKAGSKGTAPASKSTSGD